MRVGQAIEQNLWQIICGVMALVSGYFVGQNETRNQIDLLRREMSEIRASLERQRKFNACATYHMTRLEGRQKGEIPRCLE